MRDQSIQFLRRDPLRHIVLLKMLQAHEDLVHCVYRADGAEEGVLLLLETSAFPYDVQHYADSRYVVLLATTNATRVIKTMS